MHLHMYRHAGTSAHVDLGMGHARTYLYRCVSQLTITVTQDPYENREDALFVFKSKMGQPLVWASPASMVGAQTRGTNCILARYCDKTP